MTTFLSRFSPKAFLVVLFITATQSAHALMPIFFGPGIVLPNTEEPLTIDGAKNTNVATVLLKLYDAQKPVLFVHSRKGDDPFYGVMGTVQAAIQRKTETFTFILKFSHVVEVSHPMQNIVKKNGIHYVKAGVKPISVTSTPEMRDDFLRQAFEAIPQLAHLPEATKDRAASAFSVDEAFLAIKKGLKLTVEKDHAIKLLKNRSVKDKVEILKLIIEHQSSLSNQAKPNDLDLEDHSNRPFRERAELLAPHLSDETRSELMDAVEHYELVENNPHEGPIMYNYLKFFLSLPWATSSEDVIDLRTIEKDLNASHYGMDEVKDRVLDYLALKQLNPTNCSTILCLVGPPGVGKTSICQGIARSIGKKFNRVALGGVHAESDIRGHRKTYVGAMPGRIMDAVKKVGSNNAVIALDEIDKLATQNSHAGDPSAALLEVLDPEQNHSFVDHYLNVPFDLSKIFWIVTANYLQNIPPALRDRLDIIEVPGYTAAEKVHIAQKHIFPKLIKDSGLVSKKPVLTDEVMHAIIEGYTFEAGVRSLKNKLRVIIAKYARKYLKGEELTFTVENLPDHLGKPYDFTTKIPQVSQVGVTNGLVVIGNVSGAVSFIEGVKMPGSGKLTSTGNMLMVMKESVEAAHAYARSRAKDLAIDPKMFTDWDIHINLPGAMKKDGNSAGCAFLVTLFSVLTNRPVDHTYAMTGAINLRGKIDPIGGAKEKLLGAHRSGIKHIIFPEANRKDIEEIKNLPDGIEIIFVEHIDEVLDRVLLDPVEDADHIRTPF